VPNPIALLRRHRACRMRATSMTFTTRRDGSRTSSGAGGTAPLSMGVQKYAAPNVPLSRNLRETFGGLGFRV
jgi:hypothetical protein